MELSDYLYLIVIKFIRTVKWVELQFLKLFSSWIINKAIQIGQEDWGVIFHLSEKSYKNWTPIDEEKALAKISGRYETLIHIRIRDPMVFVYIANTGTWDLGEGYVNGLWDTCKDEGDISELINRMLQSNMLQEKYFNWWNRIWRYLELGLFNMQTKSRSKEVAEKHYDLGNDLYERMLDPEMQYTCGYWANSNNLNDAQLAKMELIAKKLKLKPGMRVLDLGCGWGTLCKYLAERHGVECVGVTISKEGVEYGRRVCKGLPVEIRLQDYRDVDESFDRVVSVGMLEHVGLKNYGTFFEVAYRNLKPNGIFLCHSIAENHKKAFRYDRWKCTHIFPGGSLPNARDITKATEGLFIIEDWHNFGFDYLKTLMGWRKNFTGNWSELKGRYGDRFYRMWIYFLCLSEGCYKSRKLQLWQIVFSKDGLKEGYISVR